MALRTGSRGEMDKVDEGWLLGRETEAILDEMMSPDDILPSVY